MVDIERMQLYIKAAEAKSDPKEYLAYLMEKLNEDELNYFISKNSKVSKNDKSQEGEEIEFDYNHSSDDVFEGLGLEESDTLNTQKQLKNLIDAVTDKGSITVGIEAHLNETSYTKKELFVILIQAVLVMKMMSKDLPDEASKIKDVVAKAAFRVVEEQKVDIKRMTGSIKDAVKSLRSL